MTRKHKRVNSLRSQQNVDLSAQQKHELLYGPLDQAIPQSCMQVLQEPPTEKPDAVIQEATKPATENPVAAETRTDTGSMQMLTLAYVPAAGHAMLMRGEHSFPISTQEMMGLLFPGRLK